MQQENVTGDIILTEMPVFTGHLYTTSIYAKVKAMHTIVGWGKTRIVNVTVQKCNAFK